MNEIRQRFEESCSLHAERQRLFREENRIIQPLIDRVLAGDAKHLQLAATDYDRVLQIKRAIWKSLDMRDFPEGTPIELTIFNFPVERIL